MRFHPVAVAQYEYKEHQQTTKNTSHKLTPSAPIKHLPENINNKKNTNNYRLMLIKY
jgi:hypothetical protein